MRHLLLLILFAAVIGGVCYAAVTPLAAAHFKWLGEQTDVAGRVVSGLQAKATTALKARSLDWASVEMDGQTAVLRGVAPREEERAEALQALSSAAGAGGWLRGGVVEVRDMSAIAPLVSPYEWSAARSSGRVTLKGVVPTRAARSELMQYAGQLFTGGGVVDQMTIARSALDETAWMAVARTAISQVAVLDDGSAVLRDNSLTLRGRAVDGAARERVTQAVAHLPGQFIAAAFVEAPEGKAAPARAEAEGDSLGPITDVKACRDAFAGELQRKSVEFSGGGDMISKESYPLVNRLATVLMRCEGMVVTIIGGGETTASPEDYVRHGLIRARAVKDQFILQGVSQDRILTQAHEKPTANKLTKPPATPAAAMKPPAAPAIEFSINL
jgi:outer membrane protein OmpA-like peptidoglycan-associated protein